MHYQFLLLLVCAFGLSEHDDDDYYPLVFR
jgi:hypothetical protein